MKTVAEGFFYTCTFLPRAFTNQRTDPFSVHQHYIGTPASRKSTDACFPGVLPGLCATKLDFRNSNDYSAPRLNTPYRYSLFHSRYFPGTIP
jgi:hypothetical protein